MKPKIDRIILKIFSETPCLSPNRYTGFFILEKLLTSFLKKDKKYHKDKRYQILDAGCGRGIYAYFLQELDFKGDYLGIDLDFKKKMAFFKNEQNCKNKPDFQASFKKADLNKLNLKKRFDLILSLWTLEHVNNDSELLKTLKNHLKKEGQLILAIPSIWTWPFEFGRHGFHYYSLNRVKKLVSMAGLKIINFKRGGGPFGWFFILLYDWLSFLVLIPALVFYKILGRLPKSKTRRDLGGAELSRKILNNSIFLYKKSKMGRKIHYYLVKLIFYFDKKIPLLESSYFLILEKKCLKNELNI